MNEKQDFHIQADKKLNSKAKELSGLTNREIYELGCKTIIEQHENPLDTEIVELNNYLKKVDELYATIISRLKDKEVPTPPIDKFDDSEEAKRRNNLPLDLFKEITLYYMDDFDITDLSELGNKNKEVFRFVIMNLANHGMTIKDFNDFYNEINSE